MTNLDIAAIRAQFPALRQQVAGQPAVFFDAPGGTQVPQAVIDAMAEYLAHNNANTHGAFFTSRRTDEMLVAAHSAMADLLGCDPHEVFFGANMTSLTFALSRAIGRELQPGDEVVVTRLDHDANVAPWQALAECGAVIKTVDVDTEDCTLDMEDFAAQITPRTKLVAVGYASNAVGTINDVAAITRMAHAAGALVFIDAVHYAPHGPLDVRALDCDFLACSAYKFFAPHVGCIFGKREHLERLRPYKVRPAPDAVPERWMTGTQNHEGLAGVIAAIDYMAAIGRGAYDAGHPISRREMLGELAAAFGINQDAKHADLPRRAALLMGLGRIAAYERDLAVRLISGLLAIPGLTFYGIRDLDRIDQRTPTVSIRMSGRTPRAVAEHLAARGICVWEGNYYAIGLSERLGVEASGGMVRIGLAHYNTAEEVDRLLAALGELAG